MRMTMFPRCCGGVIIYELYSRWHNDENKRIKYFEDALKKNINKARFNDNRGFALAVYSRSENPRYVPQILEKYGFKVFDEEVNPRNNHHLVHYKCDLKRFKQPL